jgi:hypothetical protein
MINLIYISCATRAINEHELLELLKQSRIKNKKYNLTGVLFYANENFMQILEGEVAAVDQLYEAILKDDRNTGHTIIQRKKIKERDFPQWSMGFKTLNDIPPEMIKGYSTILNKEMSTENIVKQKNEVERLFNWFKICTG